VSVTETELTLGGTTQDWELPVCEIVVVVAKAFCEPNETRQRKAKKAEYLALTDSLRTMDYLLTLEGPRLKPNTMFKKNSRAVMCRFYAIKNPYLTEN
jgi:hypothetical protein